MKLDTAQVQKVAKLANLTLTPEEEKKYSEQLSKILDYIEELNDVNTDSVEPTFNVVAKDNIFREDIVGKSLSQEDALLNAPNKKNNQFVSKGVFSNE